MSPGINKLGTSALILMFLTSLAMSQSVRSIDIPEVDLVADFYDIAQGDGHYVAMANLGRVARSDDGVKWQEVQIEMELPLSTRAKYAVTWFNDRYVITNNNKLWMSPDGHQWTDQTPEGLGSFSWDGVFFYAGPRYPQYRSRDLVNWENVNNDQIMDKMVTNGQFYIALKNNKLYESTDGNSFNRVTDYHFYDLIWTGSQFVAVGGWRTASGDYTHGKTLVSSTNKNWQLRDLDVKLDAVGHANGMLLATSHDDISYTSTDGLHWTATQDLPGGFVHWDGTKWITAGLGGRVETSPDATNWTRSQARSNVFNLNGVTMGTQGLVTVSNSGLILHSRNLADWTPFQDGESDELTEVVWTGDFFLAAGVSRAKNNRYQPSYEHRYFKSLDGLTWSKASGFTMTTRTTIKDLEWTGQHVVAVGKGADSSSDGENFTGYNYYWERTCIASREGQVIIGGGVNNPNVTVGPGDDLRKDSFRDDAFRSFNDIVWTGERYVAVGNGGLTGISTDGFNWKTHYMGVHEDLLSACTIAEDNANGSVFAVGRDGLAYFSNDGIHWSKVDLGTDQDLNDVAYYNDRLYVVGDLGLLLEVDPSPFPLFTLPWLINHESMQSEITLYNHSEAPAMVTLNAVSENGESRRYTRILQPGQLFHLKAENMFPGLSNYTIYGESSIRDIFATTMATSDEVALGSPAQMIALSADQLSDAIFFNHLALQDQPRIVICRPGATEEIVSVNLEIFGQQGLLVQQEVQLVGNQPLRLLVTDLFNDQLTEPIVAIKASSLSGRPLAGASYTFNDQGEPSMSQAVPVGNQESLK